MPLNRISAVIITRDAAHTLAGTLESLSGLPEVVVYDNGSADDTLAVAGRFANVRVVEGRFDGFGPTRNRAADYAANDWILSIDADERVDTELARSLDAAPLDDPDRVYALNRENWLMGRPVRHGGWGNDWPKRLYHRGRVAFSDAPVHEGLAVGGSQRVERLQGRLVHDAVSDLGDFLAKVNRYSALREHVQRPLHPVFIVPRASWAFARSYFLQAGFLAGWRGLAIAWSNANGVFYKYLRAYARRQRAREDHAKRDR